MNYKLKQKLLSIILVLLTIPIVIFDHDLTATVFMLIFAVPMFLTKERWVH